MRLWLNDRGVKLSLATFPPRWDVKPSLTSLKMDHKWNQSVARLCYHVVWIIYSSGYHFISHRMFFINVLWLFTLWQACSSLGKVIWGYRWIKSLSGVQWIDIKSSLLKCRRYRCCRATGLRAWTSPASTAVALLDFLRVSPTAVTAV